MTAKLRFLAFLLLVYCLVSIPSVQADTAQTESAYEFRLLRKIGRPALNQAAWRLDGQWIAVSSAEGVWLYTNTSEDIARLTTGPSAALAWHPDGRRLAIGLPGGHIAIWDVTARMPLYDVQLPDMNDMVQGVSWSPNGRYLSAADPSGTHLWDATSGRLIRTIPTVHQGLTPPSWSPDSTRLALALDAGVSIYSITANRILSVLHTDHVSHVVWSPLGDKIATVNMDVLSANASSHTPAIHLWDALTGQLLLAIQVERPGAIAWSPDGQWLVSGANERMVLLAADANPLGLIEGGLFRVRVWDASKGALEQTFSCTRPVSSVMWRADGRQLGFVCDDNAVHLYSWPYRNAEVTTIDGHLNSIYALDWSPDQGHILSAGADGGIRIWDVNTGQLERAIFGPSWPVWAAAWSRDGKLIATGGANFLTTVRDASTGRLTGVTLDHRPRMTDYSLTYEARGIRALAWNRLNRLASGGSDGTIQFWSMDQVEIQRIEGEAYPIEDISWHPDDRTLLVARGTLELWDSRTMQRQATLRCEAEGIATKSAFSEDGKYIAGGYASLCIWETNTRQLIHTLEEHVHTIAWRPGTAQLAVLIERFEDRFYLEIWDMHTQHKLASMPATAGIKMSWSRDGSTLAIANFQAPISIWELAPHSS